MDIIIDVDHIIDDAMKLFYDAEHQCFKSTVNVGIDEERIDERVECALRENGIECIIDITDAYAVNGVNVVSVLSIVWYDKRYGLHLRTYVLEDI